MNCPPVLLVSRKSRRSVFPQTTLCTRSILLTSEQGHEDAIENMKIQFAAVSEEKAEFERQLEPLIVEDRELKK